MKNLLELMRRLMNRDAAIVLAALAFGGIALYVADGYLEHQETLLRTQILRERDAGTTQVIVAKMDLAAGAEISEDTVAVRAIPTEYVHAEALRPDKFDAVKGKLVDRKLEKGRALLFSYVTDGLNGFSDGIMAGHRALTLNVDEVSSINGLVRPGDKMDLIVTSRDAGNAAVRPLLYDVKVLATGQLTAASSSPDAPAAANMGLSYSTITLEVTPREAEEVILARETGQVTAMLRRRNSKETDVLAPLAEFQPRAAAGAAHAAARPAGREVDYILGGRGDGRPEFLRMPIDMTAWAAGDGGSSRPQLPALPQRRAGPPEAPRASANVAGSPVVANGAPVVPGMVPGVPVQFLPADSPYFANPEPVK